MKTSNLGIAISLVLGGLVAGCSEVSDYKKIEPAKVEKIKGSKLKLITLTPEAIKRIDLKTAVVREAQVKGDAKSSVARKVIPYGSLIYDEYGKTWVYARKKERSFERKSVEVDYIEGNDVVLVKGPPKETEIATSGAAELYGVEGGIGGGKK